MKTGGLKFKKKMHTADVIYLDRRTQDWCKITRRDILEFCNA